MAALIGLTAAQLYSPWVIRQLVALVTYSDPQLKSKALQMAAILFIAYAIQGLSQYIRSYYTHLAAWNFVSDMRIRVYDHLQKLSLKYYHDKQTGQLMSRTTNDTANLETLIAHAAPDLIINILILIGVTIILFSINIILAFLSLATVPFLVIATRQFAIKVLPSFKHAQQTLAEFNATLHDNLSGIKEIQVFNQQKREKKRIEHKSVSHSTAILKALKMSAIYHPVIQFFNNIGTVLVIGYGGVLAYAGRVPVEDIVAFVLYLSMFYQPINTLGRINEDLQNALAGAHRIFEVLDEEPDVKESLNAIELGRAKGKIQFDNVSFNYLPGTKVLKNISLNINPGEMIALVGPTGVGKTTLISLMARFYDAASGSVKIDGYDIKDISLRSLRDNISIVLQDVFLFNGTVAENIAYGSENACMEDIVHAAKVAHAHEFIECLENGYDTIIGERGIKLSGGQKQRLSIARAVLRNTPILIMDEATASVDVETEQLIHQAIDSVIKDRTTIIIAHRLSSVKKADKIIVLNDGCIEEMGTHQQLLEKGGLYSHLCSIQFKEHNI
jgi:ATP-binding cassette subfamily B protein